MNKLKKAYQDILSEIPEHVQLVAVSKTKPIEMIQALYDEGQRVFGENRVQELTDKHQALPKDIEWHMIGHLQSKKTKYIAPFVSLIHSVDSIKLLKIIDQEAKKNDRTIDCLIQFHIANEESKYGFDITQVDKQLEEIKALNLENVNLRGVMGMATFTDDDKQISKEFEKLKHVFNQIKASHLPSIDILSMGMSDDYKIAINHGSNMIRVGSSIFGSR